jgi:hypothetical protein
MVRRHGRQICSAGIAVSNGGQEWQASLAGRKGRQELRSGPAGRTGGQSGQQLHKHPHISRFICEDLRR